MVNSGIYFSIGFSYFTQGKVVFPTKFQIVKNIIDLLSNVT